jgi:hypothetical protein
MQGTKRINERTNERDGATSQKVNLYMHVDTLPCLFYMYRQKGNNVSIIIFCLAVETLDNLSQFFILDISRIFNHVRQCVP